jgi:hypothetical protein
LRSLVERAHTRPGRTFFTEFERLKYFQKQIARIGQAHAGKKNQN